MTKHALILMFWFLIVFSKFSFGAEISLSNYKAEDVIYKYFIGVGDGKGQSEAFQKASENAFQNASASLFGVYVETNQTSLETISDIGFTKKNKLTTDKVKFIKFELIDKTESKSELFEARLLFRYPKAEYKKELERLREVSVSVQKSKIEEDLNVIGSNTTYPQIVVKSFYKGTEVPDADVFINGEKVAFTPLKLRKKLKIGLNRIEIIHPEFNDYIKDFELTELKDLEFNIELKKAMSLVTFVSDESETKVFINDNFVGFAPFDMNLATRRKFDIKFTKDGFEDVVVSGLQVDKGDHKQLKIKMIKKSVPFDDSEIGCFDDPTEVDSI